MNLFTNIRIKSGIGKDLDLHENCLINIYAKIEKYLFYKKFSYTYFYILH